MDQPADLFDGIDDQSFHQWLKTAQRLCVGASTRVDGVDLVERNMAILLQLMEQQKAVVVASMEEVITMNMAPDDQHRGGDSLDLSAAQLNTTGPLVAACELIEGAVRAVVELNKSTPQYGESCLRGLYVGPTLCFLMQVGSLILELSIPESYTHVKLPAEAQTVMRVASSAALTILNASWSSYVLHFSYITRELMIQLEGYTVGLTRPNPAHGGSVARRATNGFILCEAEQREWVACALKTMATYTADELWAAMSNNAMAQMDGVQPDEYITFISKMGNGAANITAPALQRECPALKKAVGTFVPVADQLAKDLLGRLQGGGSVMGSNGGMFLDPKNNSQQFGLQQAATTTSFSRPPQPMSANQFNSMQGAVAKPAGAKISIDEVPVGVRHVGANGWADAHPSTNQPMQQPQGFQQPQQQQQRYGCQQQGVVDASAPLEAVANMLSMGAPSRVQHAVDGAMHRLATRSAHAGADGYQGVGTFVQPSFPDLNATEQQLRQYERPPQMVQFLQQCEQSISGAQQPPLATAGLVHPFSAQQQLTFNRANTLQELSSSTTMDHYTQALAHHEVPSGTGHGILSSSRAFYESKVTYLSEALMYAQQHNMGLANECEALQQTAWQVERALATLREVVGTCGPNPNPANVVQCLAQRIQQGEAEWMQRSGDQQLMSPYAGLQLQGPSVGNGNGGLGPSSQCGMTPSRMTQNPQSFDDRPIPTFGGGGGMVQQQQQQQQAAPAMNNNDWMRQPYPQQGAPSPAQRGTTVNRQTGVVSRVTTNNNDWMSQPYPPGAEPQRQQQQQGGYIDNTGGASPQYAWR